MPPKDTRRLPVPEGSRPPYSERVATVLVNEKGLRKDGRTPETVRPIFSQVGMITSARGSAYVELNRTKVICAVYGPREVVRRDEFCMTGHLLCEMKFATFSSRVRRQHQPDADEKEYGEIIREALESAVILERFPKARLDVFITVLEDDGSALSAALSCASLALANAAVEMYDIVVGASLRRLDDITIVDPTAAEQSQTEITKAAAIDCGVTIGYMPSLKQISALILSGTSDETTNKQCIELCINTCCKLRPILQQCIVESIKDKEKIVNGSSE